MSKLIVGLILLVVASISFGDEAPLLHSYTVVGGSSSNEGACSLAEHNANKVRGEYKYILQGECFDCQQDMDQTGNRSGNWECKALSVKREKIHKYSLQLPHH